jgi:hypothetical protein
MVRAALIAAVGAAAIATLPMRSADAQADRVRAGTLECSVSSSVGLIVGSERNVNCLFRRDYAPPEAYVGTITRVGLDVGVTSGGAIIWTVFTGTNRYAGMLDGTYVGASAEASIAMGLGANVLVGGSDRSVALQPVSVQGQAGFNVAAGATSLNLHLAQ